MWSKLYVLCGVSTWRLEIDLIVSIYFRASVNLSVGVDSVECVGSVKDLV